VLKAPGRSARDRVAQWLALKANQPSLKNKEIAEMLGISPITLQQYIGQGRKAGWLQFDDPLDKVEHLIIPKTVDNLMEFLNQKDKTVTLETAKGTIFKQYQASKGIQEGGQQVLALKIEMPTASSQVPKIAVGQIVGQPKVLIDG
jgi:transposase